MRRFVFSLAIVGCAALSPLAAKGNDQLIAQTVTQKLAQEKQAGNLRGFGIKLTVDRGTVFMNGRVSSPEQQQLALQCAQTVPGVKQVVNELKVTQSQVVQSAAQTSIDPAAEMANLSKSSRKSAATEEALQPPQPMPAAPIANVPYRQAANQMPRAFAPAHTVARRQDVAGGMAAGVSPGPAPQYLPGSSGGVTPAQYDHPQMPGYAWPSYASHPNYAAVTYPRQYSPTAWPYIGPFYPYPQVPLGWRKVTLEWDDGWWMLDFQDTKGTQARNY